MLEHSHELQVTFSKKAAMIRGRLDFLQFFGTNISCCVISICCVVFYSPWSLIQGAQCPLCLFCHLLCIEVFSLSLSSRIMSGFLSVPIWLCCLQWLDQRGACYPIRANLVIGMLVGFWKWLSSLTNTSSRIFVSARNVVLYFYLCICASACVCMCPCVRLCREARKGHWMP